MRTTDNTSVIASSTLWSSLYLLSGAGGGNWRRSASGTVQRPLRPQAGGGVSLWWVPSWRTEEPRIF